MPNNSTPILMTAENPDGWKLEDIAAQLLEELKAKDAKLDGDERDEIRSARMQNANIMHHLRQIVVCQEKAMAAFAKLGPDQGPRGTPRAGG